MSSKVLNLTEELYGYLLKVSLREHPVLAELRAETQRHPRATMQIAPDQGQFMALLTKLIRARRAIEVGTFTGYSSLAVALAMPDDGLIVCCDVSDEFTQLARRAWDRAGVTRKCDLRLAPGLETLDALLAEGGAGTYDLAFIDADKSNYDGYYERILTLLRPGGLCLIDNVLWSGSVARPSSPSDDADTRALRALNDKLLVDERIDLSMLAIADGLTLARKR